MKKLILSACFLTILVFSAAAQQRIAAKSAAKHMGSTVMVCDKVYNVEEIKGAGLTLLTLGDSYPNQDLSVLIKVADKSKFKQEPETYFNGRAVCVTGKIVEYKGKPAIYVTGPSELKPDLVDNRIMIPVAIPKR